MRVKLPRWIQLWYGVEHGDDLGPAPSEDRKWTASDPQGNPGPRNNPRRRVRIKYRNREKVLMISKFGLRK